jgi:hypothetical protein
MMPGATLMRSVGRVVGLNKSRRNEERMRLFVGRKKVGSFVRVGEGGGWVPDKGSLMVFGGWAGSSTQEPCRGFAAPSDQSPSHKSASAWPSARSTSEAAVKTCRSGAKNKQHAGRACCGQARQKKEWEAARVEAEGRLEYIANAQPQCGRVQVNVTKTRGARGLRKTCCRTAVLRGNGPSVTREGGRGFRRPRLHALLPTACRKGWDVRNVTCSFGRMTSVPKN